MPNSAQPRLSISNRCARNSRHRLHQGCSDGRHALDQGAHLALLFNDDRVEFDVNLLGLQKSNIRASSQMLKLARTVVR